MKLITVLKISGIVTVKKFDSHVQTDWNVDFAPSQRFCQNKRKLSQLFQRYMKAVTSRLIAVITKPIGFAFIAAFRPFCADVAAVFACVAAYCASVMPCSDAIAASCATLNAVIPAVTVAIMAATVGRLSFTH